MHWICRHALRFSCGSGRHDSCKLRSVSLPAPQRMRAPRSIAIPLPGPNPVHSPLCRSIAVPFASCDATLKLKIILRTDVSPGRTSLIWFQVQLPAFPSASFPRAAAVRRSRFCSCTPAHPTHPSPATRAHPLPFVPAPACHSSFATSPLANRAPTSPITGVLWGCWRCCA